MATPFTPLRSNKSQTCNSKKKSWKKNSSCKRKIIASSPFTPSAKKEKKNNLSLSNIRKKGGKIVRMLTPPRLVGVGCIDNISENMNHGHIPKLSLSTKFSNASKFELRSSEAEPSDFQVTVPTQDTTLARCKICCVIDNYTEIAGVNFDFSCLMPWKVTNTAVPKLTPLKYSKKKSIEYSENIRQKNDILASLKDCIDDIVVEGFFRHFTDDENKKGGSGRVEACVFSSNKLRQFIVCYRGSSDEQDRPIQGQKGHTSIFNEKIGTNVNQRFSSAYNNQIEDALFQLLDRLSALKPFFDVVMLGHSFGGALALMGSSRYASLNHMIRVSCLVFGSPRIAGEKFRNHVHSLPNLKIIRIERDADPFISLPDELKWTHVGHSIKLNNHDVKAYRFDKLRPSSTFVKNSVISFSNLTKLKIGNEIKSYIKDLEKIISLKIPWVENFVGEEGLGVSGKDSEIRCLV